MGEGVQRWDRRGTEDGVEGVDQWSKVDICGIERRWEEGVQWWDRRWTKGGAEYITKTSVADMVRIFLNCGFSVLPSDMKSTIAC